jgi:hypothetical protein
LLRGSSPLLARHIGQHHAVDLDAGGKGLARLAHHLGVALTVADDVDILVIEAILAEDGADAIGPTAGRLEIGFDCHSVI